MKKQLVLATAATLLTYSAYATKARMTALNQSSATGSHYIDDTRSIFRNAAYVNQFKNYILAEAGTGDGATRAEGGFFREAGAFTYGIYMGSNAHEDLSSTTASDTANGDVTVGNASFLDNENEIDLFFGGDMGVEWGLRVHRVARSKKVPTTNVAEQTRDNLGIGLGVVMGDIDGYFNMDLKNEAVGDGTAQTAGNAKWEGDNMNLGVAYGWNAFTFFADYHKYSSEYTAPGGATPKTERDFTDMTVGVGHIKEISSTSRLYSNVSYTSSKEEAKDNATSNANNDEETTTSLPVVVGFETDAASWLTVRASAKQNFIINKTELKDTGATTGTTETDGAESTTLGVGATLEFGKFKIDGTLATAGAGTLNANSWLSNISLHYWF